MFWKHNDKTFEMGSTPLIMGILNLTPDSFSDGGSFSDQASALSHAEKLISSGASILDIGGESTRPGAIPVSAEEEWKRVRPVIREIRRAWPDIAISIDTYKASVAREALKEGASIINDVGAARWDPAMRDVVKESQAGYVCVHALARPQDMQSNPGYDNVVQDILRFLQEQRQAWIADGVDEQRLIFDVGIGFGKTLEHNLALIREQDAWTSLERPLLWGLSRKSFIGKILGSEVDSRLIGSLASYAFLLQHPVPQVWRVHDVAETRQLVQMWRELRGSHD